MRPARILALCAVLTACATDPVDVSVQCVSPMSFNQAEWDTLSGEWVTLKKEHPTYLTVTKFIPAAMREDAAVTACAAAQKAAGK